MTLKELLIEKNVTQKKLAKETGISTSTISNYVSGAINITAHISCVHLDSI